MSSTKQAFWGPPRKPVSVLWLTPGLARVKLRRIKPVLVRTLWLGWSSGLWLARRLDVPLVVTFHGFDVTMKEYSRKYSYEYRGIFAGSDNKKGSYLSLFQICPRETNSTGFPSRKYWLVCWR